MWKGGTGDSPVWTMSGIDRRSPYRCTAIAGLERPRQTQDSGIVSARPIRISHTESDVSDALERQRLAKTGGHAGND